MFFSLCFCSFVIFSVSLRFVFNSSSKAKCSFPFPCVFLLSSCPFFCLRYNFVLVFKNSFLPLCTIFLFCAIFLPVFLQLCNSPFSLQFGSCFLPCLGFIPLSIPFYLHVIEFSFFAIFFFSSMSYLFLSICRFTLARFLSHFTTCFVPVIFLGFLSCCVHRFSVKLFLFTKSYAFVFCHVFLLFTNIYAFISSRILLFPTNSSALVFCHALLLFTNSGLLLFSFRVSCCLPIVLLLSLMLCCCLPIVLLLFSMILLLFTNSFYTVMFCFVIE